METLALILNNAFNFYKLNLRLKCLPGIQETRVQSLGREDPLEKEMATHSSILSWKIYGQSNLAGYSPWSHKELDMTEATEHSHMLIE